MSRLSGLVARLLILSGIFALLPTARGAEVVRELLVPMDRLPLFLGAGPDRVLLPREEYERLLREARRTEAETPPLATLANAADIHIAFEQERARVEATLTLDVLQPGHHAIELPFEGLGIRAALLDDAPAPLGRSDAGTPTLFLQGVGTHSLFLHAVTPLATTTARQTLSFQMPVLPATTMTMTVPGDVELRSGAAAISRTYDAAEDETRFELLPPASGQVSLAVTLNSRQKRQDRTVIARSVIVDEIAPETERLRQTVSCDVLHRAVDRFGFRVPHGFEITAVDCADLARWELVGTGGDRRLNVFLRKEKTGTVVIHVNALRTQPDLTDWALPRLRPMDMLGGAAVAGILLDERLELVDSVTDRLIPIENRILVQALPPGATGFQGRGSALRPLLAHYAPGDSFAMSATFRQPPGALQCTSNALLILRRNGLNVEAAFTVRPANEKRFELNIPNIPPAWTVTAVTTDQDAPLPFERYLQHDGRTRIHVRLPSGLPAGQHRTFILQAEHVPEDWFAEWDARQVDFPVFTIADAEQRSRGAIAVRAEDDLRILPETLDSLTPLNEKEKAEYGLAGVATDLAYRHDTSNYAASFNVRRAEPRITTESLSFFRITTDHIACHLELLYDIRRAGTDRLSFSLPAETPASVSLSMVQGATLKEYLPQEQDERRVWLVDLAERTRGIVHLAVDFEQPMDRADAATFTLPLPRAEGVAFQAGLLAVEGNAELNVRVDAHPRPVDIGEMVDARYQPGARLLGAYEFVGPPPPVTVQASRPPLLELPAVVVQNARLVTALGADGLSQTSAEYAVRSKAVSVEIQLPEGAQLWSALLNGEPANPRGQGEQLLIDLPDCSAGAPHTLRVVYAMPVHPMGFVRNLETTGPVLRLYSSTAQASPVPVVTTQWHLYTPRGFEVIRSHGPLTCRSLRLPTLAAVKLPGLLYELGGEASFRRGLISALVRTPLLSIPAIVALVSLVAIVMHLRNKIRQNGLRGFLVGAVQVAVILVVVGVLAALFLPALGKARQKAYRVPKSQAQPGFALSATTEVPEENESERMRTPGGAGAEPEPRPAKQEMYLRGDEQREAPPTKSPSTPVWAVRGLRSLSIDLSPDGNATAFTGAGQEPRLHVTVWNADRIDALAWAVASLVFVAGAALTGRRVREKILYVVGVVLLSIVLALLPGLALLVPVLNAAFWAACALVLYFLLAPVALRLFPFLRARRTSAASPSVARACLWLAAACALTSPPANAQTEHPRTPNSPRPASTELTPRTLYTEPPPAPIQPPQDAILVPYDPESLNPVDSADRVLIPRARFQSLWLKAQPDPAAESAPAVGVVPAGGHFEGVLGDGDALRLEGALFLDGYTEGPAEFLLPLEGAVLTEATLDDAPARVRILQAGAAANAPVQQRGQQTAQQAERPQPGTRSLLAVTVPGAGRHRFQFGLRIQLDRQGGWRVASAVLPAVPGTGIDLSVQTAGTEVRLRHVPDRHAYETTEPNQRIETVTAQNGRFHVQWRPKIARGQRDPTLTAESQATFEVREDSLHLAWRLTLRFRDAEREVFALRIPEGYRINAVQGENVRGWEMQGEGDDRRLNVELLKASADAEAFTIQAWRPQDGLAFGDGHTLAVPSVDVVGAVRHIGRIVLRTSRALELRVLETADVSRVDVDRVAPLQTVEAPLGVRSFQAYDFRRVPFRVDVSARPLRPDAEVQVRTLLRVAERERRVETNLELTVRNRPLFVIHTRVPKDLRIESVDAPGTFEWVTKDTPEGQRLTVRFSEGLVGTASVVFAGQLGAVGPMDRVELPRIDVLTVNEESGEIAVTADPAFDVQPADLTGLEPILPRAAYGWVHSANRRHLRHSFRYKAPAYHGTLVISSRKPHVRCWTLTNARLTDRVLEETMLLTFTIHGAGLQRVQFQLPEDMADAQINVPMLRRRTLAPADRDGWVDITLDLQDEIIGELRVLVEHDRALPKGRHVLAPPVVQTGTTSSCYLAVENAGRDEVLTEPSPTLEGVSPDRREWKKVAPLLREGATEVYFSPWRTDAESIPSLTFRTRRRETVSTAGARIGLAQTVLVLDDDGYYRGQQSYRVDNQTEQFLVVALPEGASLLSARVAGRLVKPAAPEASKDSFARIPLVKTAPGELDYEVLLKYGGQRHMPGVLRTTHFPLLQTVNVKVERSQVELRLPISRQWSDFRGTMRQLGSREDLEGYFLEYQTRQAKRLLQTLKFGSKFSQARAYSNVKKLNTSLERNQRQWKQTVHEWHGRSELKRQIAESQEVLEKSAEELHRTQDELEDIAVLTNGIAIRDAYEGQYNDFAKNQVLQHDRNWEASAIQTMQTEDYKDGRTTFNAGWFQEQNLDQVQFSAEGLANGQVYWGGERDNLADDDGLGKARVEPPDKRKPRNDMKAPQLRGTQSESAQTERERRARSSVMTGRAGQEQAVFRYQQRMEQQAQQADAPVVGGIPVVGRLGGDTPSPPRDGTVTATYAGAGYGPSDVNGLAASGKPSGLASLDFALPEFDSSRWTRRFFTTPRGDLEIRARSIAKPSIQRAKRAGVATAALALAAILYVLIQSASIHLNPAVGARTVSALGAAGLLFGILPVYALLLLAAGAIWHLVIGIQNLRALKHQPTPTA